MPGKVRPIKPKDVIAAKKEDIPDVVFSAFNELIVQNWVWDDGFAKVLQLDVVALVLAKGEKGLTREEIFAKHWLNVEKIYRSVGWDVEYNTPEHSESYEPFFMFRRKQGK